MELLEVNSTPVRTANNFGINKIAVNVEIPSDIRDFDNVEIVKENSIIEEKNLAEPLTYGIDKELEKTNFKKANSKIKIINCDKKENVKILYTFDEDNLNLLDDIEIVASKDIDVTIEYKSNTNDPCFHSGIIRTNITDGAKVNVFVVNLLNKQSNNFLAFENHLEDETKLFHTIIDIGGKNSITNYYSNVVGKQSQNDVKSIYLGAKDEIKDINYIIELRGEKSKTDIDVQGALKDNCKKHFKGTIDFKKGCKKAKGNENEYCMLLSDKAKSIALPMLLCTEDDVEGNHSTASGKVDNQDLFYIMSRGLSYTDAIKLIVKARFNEIVENLEEDLKQEVLEEVDKILD